MFIGGFFYEFPKELVSLNFTTIYYIAFIFIVFCLSRVNKSKLRPYVLLLANSLFVLSFGINDLIALVVITIVSYLLSYLIYKSENKIALSLSIVAFVLMLGIFKYHSFFKFDNLIMPLGLSFYSFKIMSYLIDISRDKTTFEINPIYFVDYVMFFPTIIAGPINRAKPFMEWLKKDQDFDYKDAKGGAFQMLLGIFEKMVFDDYLAIIVNSIFTNEALMGNNILLGIILYSFQIYYDFDALSNIAIGSARLLGLKLPKNFNCPYLASNLKDFWHRWHISLSTWFKDYLYIPLGGNRKGVIRKYLNLVIVFVVSGLWHGNTLNFLIWGLLHGLIQVLEDLLLKPFKTHEFNQVTKYLLKLLGVITNFIIVTALWLVFKCQSIQEVTMIISRLMTSQAFDIAMIGISHAELYWLIVIIVTMFILDILRNRYDMIALFNRQIMPIRWMVYLTLIVIFMIFGVYGGSFQASDFIYRFF